MSEWQYSVGFYFIFCFFWLLKKKSQISAFDSFCVSVFVYNCVNTLEFGRIISFNSLTVCWFSLCKLSISVYFLKCTGLLLISFIYSFFLFAKMCIQNVRMSKTKLKIFNADQFYKKLMIFGQLSQHLSFIARSIAASAPFDMGGVAEHKLLQSTYNSYFFRLSYNLLENKQFCIRFIEKTWIHRYVSVRLLVAVKLKTGKNNWNKNAMK